MRFDSVAAIFLLGALMASAQELCKYYPAVPCPKEGKEDWFRLDQQRCFKAFFGPQFLNFTEAEASCVGLGGHLVSIHNLDQLQEVVCSMFRLTPDRPPYWIGLKLTFHHEDLLVYDWTDGTDFDFSRWAYMQPDFYNNNQECVDINYRYWGQWNDVSCSYRRGHICEVNV